MSSPSLDPELLRAFVAVAEHLSFTRAGEHLNRTQAAVSLQVRRLEDRLGVALFRRSTARVELTVAGEGFLLDARRILALNEQAIARISGQTVTGRIRLGVMEDYGTRLLPPILAELAERFPLAQVEMEIGLTSLLLKRLSSSFDAVLAMHREDTAEGEIISRENAVWVAAADRPVEDCDPLPVALSNPDCLFRTWATEALDNNGIPWRLAYVSQSLAAVEAIVERGLAVTVMKGSMVSPRLRRLPPGRLFPSLPRAEIRLHRARTLGQGEALIIDYVAERLRSLASAAANSVASR